MPSVTTTETKASRMRQAMKSPVPGVYGPPRNVAQSWRPMVALIGASTIWFRVPA